MDDSDFLDLIYSQWARTTGAENRYWMYDEDSDGVLDIRAVSEDGSRNLVASQLRDEDADFITAVHGCFPDLIRKTREALDEADRLDTERDEQEGRIAELEIEVDSLNERLLSYGERLKEAEATSEGLAVENRELERWLDNGGPESPAPDCSLGDG